jgi:hypothetical protein
MVQCRIAGAYVSEICFTVAAKPVGDEAAWTTHVLVDVAHAGSHSRKGLSRKGKEAATTLMVKIRDLQQANLQHSNVRAYGAVLFAHD